MSPKSAPFPCPDLVRQGDLYFCRHYERSPDICKNFEFPEHPACPYGLNELGLSYPEDIEIIQDRIQRGAAIIRELEERRAKAKKM